MRNSDRDARLTRPAFTIKTVWTAEQIEQHLSGVLADAERILADRAHADGHIAISFVSPISYARKTPHSSL